MVWRGQARQVIESERTDLYLAEEGEAAMRPLVLSKACFAARCASLGLGEAFGACAGVVEGRQVR